MNSTLAQIKVVLGRGRECTDRMHNLRRTLMQHWSFELPTVSCLVDFASSFDSVGRFRGLPMADNGGGWNAPETLGAFQGVLLVDQDEVWGKWE